MLPLSDLATSTVGLAIVSVAVLFTPIQCIAQSAEKQSPGQANSADAVDSFTESIQPVLDAHCVDCHGKDDPDGALDLTAFDSTRSVKSHFAIWDLIRQRVADGEMPPADSGYDIEPDDQAEFLGWIGDRRDDFIERHAGDPGEVLAHRLSASEYNYTIADLTGVDIRPADSFPIDPSNTAGFDNSGESLVMTPSLLSKYIDAARFVSDHVLFLPDGLGFAPHPVVTDTDRDKYCVRQIVDFYESQTVAIEKYLFAIWELRQRSAQAKIDSDAIDQTAASNRLSAKYLTTLWETLNPDRQLVGPLKQIQTRIVELGSDRDAALENCKAIANDIAELRSALTFEFPHLRVSGINSGSQPLVLWRNRQKATHRMSLNEEAFEKLVGTEDSSADESSEDQMVYALVSSDDAAADQPLLQAYQTFCRLFPDRFYVDRRGREYVGQKEKDFNRESEYRLLSAGFHSMMGYFRDDQPLCELMLTEDQRQQLDRLWFQLDFVADVPARQHSGFIWFERAEGRYLVDSEFDAFRSADKNATSPQMVDRLAEAYIAKAERIGANDQALDAMRFHFAAVNQKIQTVVSAKASSLESQIDDLERIAEKAFRRPLTKSEQSGLKEFYDQLVRVDGLNHEDAIRDVIVSILVSPHFCYRVHETSGEGEVVSLEAYELASRLSYFIWASMPDERLLELAASQQILNPEVLKAECRRLLQDEKANGLAVEFGGNWLGFRQFKSHTGVDRNRFEQFDQSLQDAMFEEPVRFFNDVLRRDGSVLDFLYADHTFVNSALAKHYGVEEDFADDSQWMRLDNASMYGRGGVLPMGVFLTKNSPGLRTSPVKRGFWVVRQLLGTHIPAPPPNVPELPEDESKLGELTLREVLAKHREHVSCSGCHEKFDSVGLVFEGFGPIGERRENDLAGNPVDVLAEFPDGSKHSGVNGLKDYIRSAREAEFVDNLCEKLLSYALGRSLMISDEPLVESMKQDLIDNQYSFSAMVETIVTSDQFLKRRL
ncbi:DUF1592 domain-containing protein [Stieleria sp. JC731]|nr:DUF1592 domain-containing protein [Stieleria sp. JC731]